MDLFESNDNHVITDFIKETYFITLYNVCYHSFYYLNSLGFRLFFLSFISSFTINLSTNDSLLCADSYSMEKCKHTFRKFVYFMCVL